MASELLDSLVRTLNDKGVPFCHWKSNVSLGKALSGETAVDLDVDLLVARNSLREAQAILLDLEFKPATVKWGPETPTVSHYYGFDPKVDHLIHVHLFSNVLTGESFVKSHLLPFEMMLLENTYNIGLMNVPSKPVELLVFVLRTFIKYGSLLDLIYLYRQSEDIKAESRWLEPRSNMSEALSLLRKYCPVIEEKLFVKCANTLSVNTSLRKRIMLARRIRRRLGIYQKYTRTKRALAYVRLLWGHLQRRLGGNRANKMLCAGGAIVALTGPEATGKSTLLSACGHWLGDVFAVRMIHGGKPPSSWLTAPVNLVLPLMRALWPGLRTSRLEGHAPSPNPKQSRRKAEGLSSVIYAFRLVMLAWDRRQLLVRARRSAANGEIVICDRYPSEEVGVMDSPHLGQDLTRGGLLMVVYNWLAGVEKRLYHQIPPPDVVLRLRVSIETAQKRNRERIKSHKETDAYVESRHRQNKDWHRVGTKYIYDIDTEGLLEETILRAKKAIWKSL